MNQSSGHRRTMQARRQHPYQLTCISSIFTSTLNN